MRRSSIGRRISLNLGALGVVALVACGGGGDSAPPSSDSGGGDSALRSPSSDDAGACWVLSANEPASCAQDSDCVLIPPGGNVCDPCVPQEPEGAFYCKLVPVNTAGAADYYAALSAAGGIPTTLPDGGSASFCTATSCPEGMAAACRNGTCAAVEAPFPGSSEDGGADGG
jgi:hypothetical protein